MADGRYTRRERKQMIRVRQLATQVNLDAQGIELDFWQVLSTLYDPCRAPDSSLCGICPWGWCDFSDDLLTTVETIAPGTGYLEQFRDIPFDQEPF